MVQCQVAHMACAERAQSGRTVRVSPVPGGGMRQRSILKSRSSRSAVSWGQRQILVLRSQFGTCLCGTWTENTTLTVCRFSGTCQRNNNNNNPTGQQYTVEALGNSTGTSRKFKQPCWMNSFWIWVQRKIGRNRGWHSMYVSANDANHTQTAQSC